MSVISTVNPDALPQRGYTKEQLKEYIFRQLGYPIWTVELSAAQVLDHIQDALNKFSQRIPQVRIQTIRLLRSVNVYLEGQDVGQGVVKVEFVEPLPTPTAIFYGNLIDPAPLFRTGLDDYDSFLRWRKMWMRCTSVQPDWYYDDWSKRLYIHNPLERYNGAVFFYAGYDTTESLSAFGAEWVKQYALEASRYQHGEILAKFGSAIPGPVKDLQLDSARRDKAIEAMKVLEDRLFNSSLSTPISID